MRASDKVSVLLTNLQFGKATERGSTFQDHTTKYTTMVDGTFRNVGTSTYELRKSMLRESDSHARRDVIEN